MTPRDFCYWLQGFFEISNPMTIDPIELDTIKDHLQLVFRKETPDRLNGVLLNDVKEFDVEAYRKSKKPDIIPISSEGYTYVEYPLSPDHSFPTLFDMENNVPVSC
jgi:hypothetical protein